MYRIGGRTSREPYYTLCGNETVEKAALRAIKHLFPPSPPAGVVYCVRPRARDFELNLKSGGPILWRPGVKCRSVAPGAGLSPGKLRDPGTKAPKGRYRFTQQVAIQDAEDRSIPFSIWTSRERARKRGVKGRGGHCFVLLALLHLDDHSKRSGYTYSSEVRSFPLPTCCGDVFARDLETLLLLVAQYSLTRILFFFLICIFHV